MYLVWSVKTKLNMQPNIKLYIFVMPEARRAPVIQRDPGARMALGTSGMLEPRRAPESIRVSRARKTQELTERQDPGEQKSSEGDRNQLDVRGQDVTGTKMGCWMPGERQEPEERL